MTTLPIGITRNTAPCWHLTGAPYAGEQHFETKQDADDEASCRGEDEAEVAALTTERLDSACWTATAACGLHLEGDEFPISHHPTADYALADALAADWQVVDGVLRCDDGEFCVARVAA